MPEAWSVYEAEYAGEIAWGVGTDLENIIAICASQNAAFRVANALARQPSVHDLFPKGAEVKGQP